MQHHKTEDQVPEAHLALWDELRSSPQVKIENAAHWNMASKRMEAQSRFGDILVALGGSEGVLYLANLYHDAGKPVVPLNLALCAETTGARRIGWIGRAGERLEQVDAGTWRCPETNALYREVEGVIEEVQQ